MRGAVGDVMEIRPHSAHDELRGLGGEAGVAPPAQAALDVGIEVGGGGAIVLGMHPGAEQAALEAMPGVARQQRPGRDVEREAGIPGLGHLVDRDQQVAGQLGGLRARRDRRRRLARRQCAGADQRQNGGGMTHRAPQGDPPGSVGTAALRASARAACCPGRSAPVWTRAQRSSHRSRSLPGRARAGGRGARRPSRRRRGRRYSVCGSPAAPRPVPFDSRVDRPPGAPMSTTPITASQYSLAISWQAMAGSAAGSGGSSAACSSTPAGDSASFSPQALAQLQADQGTGAAAPGSAAPLTDAQAAAVGAIIQQNDPSLFQQLDRSGTSQLSASDLESGVATLIQQLAGASRRCHRRGRHRSGERHRQRARGVPADHRPGDRAGARRQGPRPPPPRPPRGGPGHHHARGDHHRPVQRTAGHGLSRRARARLRPAPAHGAGGSRERRRAGDDAEMLADATLMAAPAARGSPSWCADRSLR